MRGAIEWFGGLGRFCVRAVRESFRRPFELAETLRQLFEMGARSAPLIMLSGMAVSVVLSMHTRATLERFGAAAMIPKVLRGEELDCRFRGGPQQDLPVAICHSEAVAGTRGLQ